MFFSYCFKNKYGILNIIYTIVSILTTVNFTLMGMASEQKISSLQESQNNLYFYEDFSEYTEKYQSNKMYGA